MPAAAVPKAPASNEPAMSCLNFISPSILSVALPRRYEASLKLT
ncbi:hypothetical protein L842_3272 [Mycobacterium intracellulare MIN_052511_1280]|nr:hypothetical protein L842_3272 [Mycobacterium intracellulare MIN_052511_1280]